jgi:hypothetical protein
MILTYAKDFPLENLTKFVKYQKKFCPFGQICPVGFSK